MNANLVTNH